MRKPFVCFFICENKDADQRLCFRYTDSTIPLLSSHPLWLYRPVCVGPGRKPRRPVFSYVLLIDQLKGNRIRLSSHGTKRL